MSDYEDEGSSDSDDSDIGFGSIGFLPKVKSNTPRARFDIHFHPTFIQLIQYSAQHEISHRYRIYKDNILEMLRLPYNNDKQVYFVLHLRRPIIGGNKSFTKYDFVVLNFIRDDYEEMNLDLTNDTVRDMFSEDVVNLGYISGETVDIFETMTDKIFGKPVTKPAKDYTENNGIAEGLKCTFWDNDEHFLYPLDDGFVNVWKYCQRLKLADVKDVRFVRSQGRHKTFDFYIYPKMHREIRRYHIGSSESKFINCFFLEFKVIDQIHYDGLFKFFDRYKITITTNDFRESASESSDNEGSNSDAESMTETNSASSVNIETLINDVGDVPDPHMMTCQQEGRENDSESNSSSGENEHSESSSEEDANSDQSSTSETAKSSEEIIRPTRKRKNTIRDDDESNSSASNSHINTVPDDSQPEKKSPRKRRILPISDDSE